MLRSLKKLYGEKLGAIDGDIGTVKDFYFDEKNWAIRYLVADTGNWLADRKVLISPHSLATAPVFGKVLRVSLTRKKIEKSPAVGSQNPDLRRYEQQYYRYYRWPRPDSDARLYGTQAVTGYLVRMGDETIGLVCDFMVNIENWEIGQLVVKTGHRFSGKDTLISTKQVQRISYDESTVFVCSNVELAKQPPVTAPSTAGIVL